MPGNSGVKTEKKKPRIWTCNGDIACIVSPKKIEKSNPTKIVGTHFSGDYTYVCIYIYILYMHIISMMGL